MFRRIAIILSLSLMLAVELPAQIDQPNFADVSDIVLNWSAIQAGATVRVVHDLFHTGTAWHATPQPVRDGFDCQFSFRIIPSSVVGPEGLCFMIQNSTAGPSFLPALFEGTMGYDGLPNFLVVEIDTRYDLAAGDDQPDHISVHTTGNAPNSIRPTNAVIVEIVDTSG